MDLKERLAKLRGIREAPAPGTDSVGDGDSSLRERLERFATRSDLPQTRRKLPDEEVARLLGGDLIAEGLILVERVLPLFQSHGDEPLSRIHQSPLSVLANGRGIDSGKLLFLDTETTGLAGGTGTLAFLLGLGRIEHDTLRLQQFFLTGFKGEPALLNQAVSWFKEAEHLVTFNGKCFDLPLLAARYRLSRLREPFAHLGHIDLLHPTRCAFSKNWPDCRLQTAEQRLLNFVRTDDLPGHLVPQVWFDLVRLGSAHKVPAILEHNRWDLISLAALMAALSHVYSQAEHADADLLAIARSYVRNGNADQAYHHLLTKQQLLDERGLLELASFHRRKGEWRAAEDIWEKLAARGSLEAIEHLAKYCEHVCRDYRKALTLTHSLIRQDAGQERHAQRELRLKTKLERATQTSRLPPLQEEKTGSKE